MNQSAPILSWMDTLSDPTRVRLLRVAEQHELSVGELAQVLQVPQSTTSHHLRVLSEIGWLASRRDGRSRYYGLQKDEVDAEAWRLWKLIRRQFDITPSCTEDDDRLERVILARQTQSQAFFASSAGHWDKVRREMFGERFEAACFPALIEATAQVGDLGCGTGRFAELIAAFAGHVFAIDASAAMLKTARARLKGADNVTTIRGNIENLPLDDACLDLALCVLVLHHIAEPERVLQEAARVIKPGGRLIVVDMQPHDREEYAQQFGHVWQGFSEPQLGRWLSEAGFDETRYVRLPPEPSIKGPPLFVATGRHQDRHQDTDSKKRSAARATGASGTKPSREGSPKEK